jgi:aspartyl-tRNA(Asn)/glutamyl-tRNA(Gln) amidotransferase subunit A
MGAEPVNAVAGVGATREALRSGEISATGHVQAALAAVAEHDPGLGAFVVVAGDHVLAEAEAADRAIRELGPRAWRSRPLLGVTVSVKDLVQTADLPTSRGSLLRNRRPRVDAPAVARLRAAGAIVIGKTTTSEYGWCGSSASRVAPATRNPWHPERSAGGSSGGAAVSVAAGMCAAALGTDGAGSVRIPAAFCGVVGFKPSRGRIPYVPACADRLAHLGPLATCVADAGELAAMMAGGHPGDPESGLTTAVGRPWRPLTIGWLEFPGTSSEVRRITEGALPLLAALGHHVERVEVPFHDPQPALIDVIAAAEAASTAPEDEPQCDQGRLAVVRYGRTVTGAAVMRAEEVRTALRVRLASVMERYDLLVSATVPIEPFGVDAIGPSWAADPEDLLWLAWTPATYPFNITGQPALSLPVGTTATGLPVGLHLVGPLGGDDLVLSAAAALEAVLGPVCGPTPGPVKQKP